MKKKRGFFLNKQGLWQHGESVLIHMAEIKPDKVFLCPEIRELLRPHDLVFYFPETICQLEKRMPDEMFFITVVTEVSNPACPLVIPLFMLQLAETQREEIKSTKFRMELIEAQADDSKKASPLPNEAFEKPPIAMGTEQLEEDNVLENIRESEAIIDEIEACPEN